MFNRVSKLKDDPQLAAVRAREPRLRPALASLAYLVLAAELALVPVRQSRCPIRRASHQLEDLASGDGGGFDDDLITNMHHDLVPSLAHVADAVGQ